LVTLADGRRVPIESLAPGDMVVSALLPGLRTDVDYRAQYEWLSTWGLDGASIRSARVSEILLGEHDGFYLINRRIKATFEHPFLVRRDEQWGFCSAELLKHGDHLITLENGEFHEEQIEHLEQIEGRIRTVAIRVPGTNTYLADGVWTHNDTVGKTSSFGPGLTQDSSAEPGISATGGSGTGPSISVLSSSSSESSSGSSKSSGSSFASSSESVGPSMLSSSGGTSGIAPTGGG
jgi:hypothetical protein